MGQVRSPVLTIDADRLLAETLYGRRLGEELRARTEALAAENERLRVELTEEERRLTEGRPTMEVEAFRAQAEAFDERVQRIRAEQDAKERDLQTAVAQMRERFLNSVSPVLARLMIESGAAVILERRQVFLSTGLIEVTDEAVAAIDAQIGDGLGLAEPAPGAGQATTPSPEVQDPGPGTPEQPEAEAAPPGD